MVMTSGKQGRTRGKIQIGTADPSLTAAGGMIAVTELCGKLALIEAPGAGIGPVKQRRRGFTGGQVLTGMAAAQLAGEDFLVGLDRLRADEAGQQVTPVPGLAASTATGLARRFTRKHWRGAEMGLAAATSRMLGLLPAERAGELAGGPVTTDIDATDVEVYGNKKRGVAYTYQGQRAGRPHVAAWAETEIPLAADLLAGDQDPRSSVVALLGRALAALPQAVRDGRGGGRAEDQAARRRRVLRRGPGPRRRQGGHDVRDRRQAGHHHVEGPGRDRGRRLARCHRHGQRPGGRLPLPARRMAAGHGPADPPGAPGPRAGVRGSAVPAPPHPAPRSAGAADPGTGGRTRHLRLQLHPHQRRRARPGQGRGVRALVPAPHRIENIFRDSKHGAALRHLPSGDEQASTAWMQASLIAAAIAAWLHQLTGLISGGELLEGHGTRGGKAMIATLRRALILTPARLVRHGGQLIMRLAPGAVLLPDILATLRALPAPSG